METVAALTCLDQTKPTHTCQVLGFNGHAMQLKLPQYLSLGSPVKIESDDTLSLGEVSYCHPEGDGYIVRVEILEALHNVNELTRLARALLG